MHPYQSPIKTTSHHSNRALSTSMVSSTFSSSFIQHRLPPISQPLLSKYRYQKLKVNLLANKQPQSNFFIQLLCGKQNDKTISMCEKCEKSKDLGLCTFITSMLQQTYDWQHDPKFKSTYESYNRKKINIFLNDQEIEYRLVAKFNVLGVALLENHKPLLVRIIRNYIKHTVYYGEERRLTAENDLYFWFLAGVYYHVGVPKYLNQLQSLPKDSIGVNQPMMFWMLDIVMKRLNDCTHDNLRKVSQLTIDYCRHFYPKQLSCIQHYDINLPQIFNQWTTQAMMGYMGIEFIGFYIKSILKEGFQYVQKTMLSYFEKRLMKLDKEEIVAFHKVEVYENMGSHEIQELKRTKRELIMKTLLDSHEEWPGIFYGTAGFVFEL